MSRINALTGNPKRTLGAMATVLAAVGVTIGSGADFTAQSANPNNSFTAGTLSMSNSAADAAILTAANMKPGAAAQTGVVDIGNTGSLPGTFTLSRSALSSTPASPALTSKLNVVVKDCGLFSGSTAPTCDAGVSKYTGTLAGMTGSEALGSYAAGDKHRYQFSVSLDSSADNTYQGGSSTATFQWNAVQ